MMPLSSRALSLTIWVSILLIGNVGGNSMADPFVAPIQIGVQDRSFIDELTAKALKYFLEQTHPETGLVLDRASNFSADDASTNTSMASIAATGFGLAVIAHAGKSGAINPEFAESYIRTTLNFALHHVEHYRGWFYHFSDWNTGKRWSTPGTEVSTIDTALFLAGAIYAANVFENNAEINELLDRIFDRIDFVDMLTDGGALPDSNTYSMGWFPETGYIPHRWDHYAEHMILVLMGLSRENVPTETWTAWQRQLDTINNLSILGGHLPLFVHQYSHLFLDFAKLNDDSTDFMENSRLATLANREFCKLNTELHSFREGFWGLSAGDTPFGYAAYSPIYFDGTVCIGCALGSWFLTPNEVAEDVNQWMNHPLRQQIYGRYGFTDSINLDQNWFGKDVIGITVGTIYLAIAQVDERSVQTTFMRDKRIQRALQRLSKK